MVETLQIGTPAPFVYGLVDPFEPGHVRYVGMAMQSRRPYEHAENAKRGTDHSHLFHWIRLLQLGGREPAVLLLEKLPESASRNFVGSIESMYIASLRGIGHCLTNVSLGGWGGNTGARSEASKARHSEMMLKRPPQSAESRAKQAASLRGHKASLENRANMSAAQKGHPVSETTCANISVALLGRKASDEANESNRAAQVRRYQDPAEREAQSARLKGKSKPEGFAQRVSELKLGNTNMLGKAHSVETRELMASKRREWWARQKAGL